MTRTGRRVSAALGLAGLLIACGQTPAPSASGGVPVTLRIPTPDDLYPQYVNASKTSRVDVQIDSGSATSFTLGSANAPCANGSCSIDLGLVPPAQHTFSVGTYGLNASAQPTLISQGTTTQTLTPGQNNAVSLTLTPANATTILKSAVQPYDQTLHAFGNYVNFPTRGGRSLPAYYDVSAVDSLGDPIPSVLCGNNADVAIRPISDATHPHRYRVEVQTLGPHSLNVQAGTSCTPTTPALLSQPVQGVASSDATLAAGGVHSLALLTDGTVQTWGNDTDGPLADGISPHTHLTPQAVPTLSGVAALASGQSHSLALLSDGTVRAWGDNWAGQLGEGSTTTRPTPILVSGLQDVVQIAAGYVFGLALLADGTVYAWGNNTEGELGDGTTTSALTPVRVSGLTGVSSVTAGGFHSLALLPDGTVRAWGSNWAGQLGEGSTTNRSVPVQTDVSGVTALAAGELHSLALMSDGSVRSWGYNDHGQLGDGSDVYTSASPLVVSGLGGVVRIAAGLKHSFALLADGTVRAWGGNWEGQLGDGNAPNQSNIPVTVGDVAGVVELSGGGEHSLALLSDGSVRSWGWNAVGQLGDGTQTDRVTAGPVLNLPAVQVPAP